MSIKEVGDKSKPEGMLPTEEEFLIVPVGESSQNTAYLSHHTYTVLALVLVGSISFGIGKLLTLKGSPALRVVGDEEVISPKESAGVLGAVTKVQDTAKEQDTKNKTTGLSKTSVTAPAKEGSIVASKNGTKYYSATCSGVKRIKEENKVYFASIEDAKKAGLSPSATCKDLK